MTEASSVSLSPLVQVKQMTVTQKNITDLHTEKRLSSDQEVKYATYQASQHAGKARKTQTFQKISDVDSRASYVVT